MKILTCNTPADSSFSVEDVETGEEMGKKHEICIVTFGHLFFMNNFQTYRVGREQMSPPTPFPCPHTLLLLQIVL